MEITFWGTSSGVPMRSRNVSSVALRLPQRSEVWLFDCGEGTQHQFLRSELRSSEVYSFDLEVFSQVREGATPRG